MRKIAVIVLLCWVALPLLAQEILVKHHAVIREQPYGTARALGAAGAGDKFRLIDPAPINRWYKIEYQSKEAWIYSRWIEIAGQPSVQTVKIASFNAKRLGHGTKDFDLTAKVLNGYDLIALQEVMTEAGLKSLEKSLEGIKIDNKSLDWKYVISEPIGRSGYDETYAFIWKSDKVQLKPNSYYIQPDPQDDFIREPFVASFKSGQFDFTLVSAHFIFGKKVSERRGEAEAIAGVFRQIQNKDANENDVILMGDFNLPPDDKGWKEMKKVEEIIWLIKPPAKTTIGTKTMSSLYDNIWFQSGCLTEFTGVSGTYEFMHDLIDDENVYEVARSLVSDHVPVWGEFATGKNDD